MTSYVRSFFRHLAVMNYELPTSRQSPIEALRSSKFGTAESSFAACCGGWVLVMEYIGFRFSVFAISISIPQL